MNIRLGWPFAVMVVALPLSPTAALASSSCYDQGRYPAVLRIESAPNGFRAYTVSPDFEEALRTAIESQKRSGRNPNDPGVAYTHPVIRYSSHNGFLLENALACRIGQACEATTVQKPSCVSGLPPRERLIEDARRTEPTLAEKPLDHTISAAPRDNNIDQKYGACDLRDGSTWFGISYYDGEGTTGIGGVGRYDPKTRRIELRRPEVLRESSVFHLLHDGEYLWLGTAGNHECTGTPPTFGLVRYDWNTGRALTFLDENDGPCGLLVNGLVQLGDDIWVATDLGLSRWNRRTSTWKNYVPEPQATPPMRETSCPALYRRLVETLPRNGWNEAMPAASPFHQLMETLARLRPRSLDAATLADSTLHVFFRGGFKSEPGRGAYDRKIFTTALQEIRPLAEKGAPQAQYNLGTLYARGEGVSRDFAQAASWLRKAAEQNHPQAQANLGLLLLNRARTKAEWAEAKKWLSAASAQGSVDAKTAVLLMEHSRTPASIGD